MHRLVEPDLEAVAERALAEAGEDVRATLRAWLARPREPTAADLAGVLELAEDDVVSSIAGFCDARVLAGASPDSVRADLKRIRALLERCEFPVDLDALVTRFTPKAQTAVSPNATRDELLAHLMSDPYVSTVVRRLWGIPGVVPTHAFVRAFVDLDLVPADEPNVARLVATINTVGDAHAEIIEKLRRMRK